MKTKKLILNTLLGVVNWIVCLFPIKYNQVTFVSLESNQLEQDMLQIYHEIKDEYRVKTVLIKFHSNTLWTNFLYMLNTLKQIWYINQSAVVIINDNNYVISNFKRQGVTVIQIWHAAGAIKKFGNCLKREYKIQNYDYVIANSPYWIKPYSEAFGVEPEHVKVLGMPRIDQLWNAEYKEETKKDFYRRYPELIGKKLVLYAPTFRGNIYQGFHTMNLDGGMLVESLGAEYVLLYKYHPLLAHAEWMRHDRCVNVSNEELYELFFVSEMMISDYSSIVLDYALIEKPIIFYAPDLEEYGRDIGYFIDYETVPGTICTTTQEVVSEIQSLEEEHITVEKQFEMENNLHVFQEKYFQYRDGNNTKRVVEFIRKCM